MGWDFVVSNKLDLRVTGREGGQYYCLVGPHGTTPISAARPPQEVHLSGVVEAGLRSPEPAGPTDGSDTLLDQSRLKGPTSVKLVGDVVIPARTEIIVEGKVSKKSNSEVGLVSPTSCGNTGFHVTHAVVPLQSRSIPVRLANTSSGAVLSQINNNGCEKVIAFASRTLSDRERKYSTTEKEACAVVYTMDHFRVYLLGCKFTVVTDHNALRW